MPDVQCGFDDIPGGATGRALLVGYGPTILVNIGFDASFKPKGGKVPTPGMKDIRALVDTGATQSCIDSYLASQLNLPIVDKRTLAACMASWK
jgi:hypothetical protein